MCSGSTDWHSQSELLNEFLLFMLCWHFSVSECLLRSKQYVVLQNVHFSLQIKVNLTISQDFCLNWIVSLLKHLTISTNLALLNQHAVIFSLHFSKSLTGSRHLRSGHVQVNSRWKWIVDWNLPTYAWFYHFIIQF